MNSSVIRGQSQRVFPHSFMSAPPPLWEAPASDGPPRKSVGATCVAHSRAALAQARREATQQPVQCVLGCCSVLVVVAVAATVQTLLSNAPLVFLQEAEAVHGQLDIELVPSADAPGAGEFLNYTTVAARLESAALGASNDARTSALLRNHAPRATLAASMFLLSDCDSRDAPSTSVCSSWDPVGGDNRWMYEPPSSGSPFVGLTCDNCVSLRCGFRGASFSPSAVTDVVAVDLAQDRKAGIGRSWPVSLALGPGEVVLGPEPAAALGITRQSLPTWVVLTIVDPVRIRWGFPDQPSPSGNWSDLAWKHGAVSAPFRVVDLVGGGAGGKLPAANTDFAVVDMPSLGAWLSPRMHPSMRCQGADASGTACPFGMAGSPVSTGCLNATTTRRRAAALTDRGLQSAQGGERARARPALEELSDQVIVMLPQSNRGQVYANGDADTLQEAITTDAGVVAYTAGLASVKVALPLLDVVVSRQFVALYLSLVLDICLVVLFALAAMVIYSILTVSVSSRRFEIGVRRMLGSSRAVLASMLAVQAVAYAVPGWLIGLALAAAMSRTFTNQLAAGRTGDGGGVTATGVRLLSPGAVASATALALAVPLVAAFGPIRAALSTSIRDGVSAGRSGTTSVGTEHVVERAGTGRPSLQVLTLGVMSFFAGFALYYLLPLALLSLDLGLFLALFLCIFCGMLGGAAMLALNAQGILQRCFAYGCIARCERGPIVRLAVSNLRAHAARNRLTSLMYGLAVAFVVFTATTTQQQLQASVYEEQFAAGTIVYATMDEDAATSSALGSARGPPAGAALLATPTSATRYNGTSTDASFADVLGEVQSPWDPEEVYAGSALLHRVETRLSNSGLGRWAWVFRRGSQWGASPAAAFADVSLPLYPAAQRGAVLTNLSIPVDLDYRQGFTSAASGNVGAAGVESLAPAARPMAMLFPSIESPGRTSSASLDLEPVTPRVFEAYGRQYPVRSGNDRIAPHTGPVTPASQGPVGTQMELPAIPTALTGSVASLSRDMLQGLPSVARASSRGIARPSQLDPFTGAQGWTVSDLLYTAWGANGVAGSGGLSVSLSVSTGSVVVLESSDAASLPPVRASRLRLAAQLDAAPQVRFRRTRAGSQVIGSVPLMSRLALERGGGRPLALAPLARLHPVFGDRSGGTTNTSGEVDSVRDRLALAFAGHPSWTVVDVRKGLEDLASALGALDLVFSALTAAAMFLCFFSLISAMSTNVMEQRREIGVLLALGVRARALVRAYVHEATLLVMSASSCGLIIGVAASWVFGQQRSLFTDQTIPLPIPWFLVLTVVIASAVCGLFAACLPATRLVRLPITQLLRAAN
jgi:ABC-type antimicrobial peptide transport system permease subunit